ncbi:MAG: LuxR C-terminal-related transcriptional regulator [Saprospiraceae bacterium]
MSKPIKLLIADDHDIVIDGLKSILNPFALQKQSPESISTQSRLTETHPFQIMGIAGTGEGLLERIKHLPEVDVVVLDYYMDGMNGLDTAMEIKAQFPAVKVVLFSMEESDVIITEAFVRNIDGYVTKSEGRQRLLDAIKRVHKGDRVFPLLKNAKGANKPWMPTKNIPENQHVLSKREKEIACLIVHGHTTQQIADTLDIAFNTVEVHRSNIYRKLEINRVAELVKYALENNLCT